MDAWYTAPAAPPLFCLEPLTESRVSSKEWEGVTREGVTRKRRSNKKSENTPAFEVVHRFANAYSLMWLTDATIRCVWHCMAVPFQTETALMYDAVHVFARALHRFNEKLTVRPLSCRTENSWAEGNSLVNFIKLVSGGMTGLCQTCQRHGSCVRLVSGMAAVSDWSDAEVRAIQWWWERTETNVSDVVDWFNSALL